MKNPYVRLTGKMKSFVSKPDSKLTPYIEKYVFYENENITNNVYPFLISNGKVELFIYYNNSHVSIINHTKEIKRNNFIFGISQLTNPLKIKLISESDCFKGISITFSLQGVYQILNLHLKTITNRIVSLETIFGKNGKRLVNDIWKARCNKERENILNQFFMVMLNKKKLRITTLS